jgi:cell division protein FtsB
VKAFGLLPAAELKASSSKLKAQSSKLKAQSANRKAQSSKLKAQSSKLKAQSSKLKAQKKCRSNYARQDKNGIFFYKDSPEAGGQQPQAVPLSFELDALPQAAAFSF